MTFLDRFIKWITYCEFTHGSWKRKSRIGKLFKWTVKKVAL